MQSLAFTPTESQLVEHRRAMLRFARRKIRDEALAEDTVQDALLAALSARSSFQGQSALRTWLIGILNHKIQDAFRRETRYVKIEELSDRADADSASALAAADHPVADDDPVVEVSRRQMQRALHDEVERLPGSLRSVFLLQAVQGVETSEVCRQLNITEANCWVRLHRARKRLLQRLSHHLEPA